MTGHAHAMTGAGWAVLEVMAAVLCLMALAGYGWLLWRGRGRSPWPAHRSILFCAGVLSVASTMVGPLARAAHSSFTLHMVGHLLLGMLGPLVLVWSAPVTLLLRGLSAPAARRVTRVLRTPFVRVVTHPVVAAGLNAGGLWVLYASPLFHVMHASVVVFGLVHAHIFLAGYVFTAAIASPDPDPGRASFRLRAAVLIVFIAVHSVLAKWLFVHPPTGVATHDAHVGAQVMYFGGDVVDVALIVLLFAVHHRATRPRVRTATPRVRFRALRSK